MFGLGMGAPGRLGAGPLGRRLGQEIRAMFQAGEQGLHYDPSDLSTLYQDSAGTTPVTSIGQPVGLVLDKRFGLVRGAELATNIDFDTDTAWVKSVNATITAGAATLPLDADSFVYEDVAVTVGVWHEVEIHYTTTGGGTFYVGQNTGSAPAIAVLPASVGIEARTKCVVLPTVTPMRFIARRVSGTAGQSASISKFSLRQLPGNHATQSTATCRPILRQTPVLGSELVTNGTFDADSNWTKGAGWTISGGKLNGVAGSAANASQAGALTVGKSYQVSYEVSGWTAGTSQILVGSGTAALPATGNGTFSGVFTCTGDTTLYVNKNSTFAGSIDNVSVKEVLSYRTDQNYLEFDGIDDFLVTQSIDFTATDKMTVWAGIRKLSDAAFAPVVELTTSSAVNGSFYVGAPGNAGANYGISTRGVTANISGTYAGHAAPHTALISCALDNAGSGTGDSAQIRPRINGVQQVRVSGTSPGNYANAQLYIGRRGGASNPFNGYLHSLIIRGAASSDAQIGAGERYVAQKTGVTL